MEKNNQKQNKKIEAQKFLVNKGYNDLVITNPNIVDPKKWVYVSDVIMEFQHNLTSHQSGTAGACCAKCKDIVFVDWRCPYCGRR